MSPGRLPSIRARDLTLGGAKKAEGEPRRERKDGGGRGRGRGRAELIQSRSIFEERPAEMTAKKRRVVAAYESAAAARPPVVKIKRETEEETEEILERVLERVNILDDPSLRGDERSRPVQLPLAVSGWAFKEGHAEDALLKVEKVERDEGGGPRPAIRVKQEPPEDDVALPIKREPVDNLSWPPCLPEPDLLSELLRRWSLSSAGEEELLFVQLPDSLPDLPRGAKEPGRTQHGSQTESQQERPEEENNRCTLRDLREGRMGKMVVRRSGRVQLLLGDVALDVALGTLCAFLQDLVSIGMDGGTGDMTVLGHVKQKLVCSPDFEALLQENRTR